MRERERGGDWAGEGDKRGWGATEGGGTVRAPHTFEHNQNQKKTHHSQIVTKQTQQKPKYTTQIWIWLNKNQNYQK